MIGVALRNPEFRKLWLSQVVSQAGDWFNRIAVISLLSELAGGEAAVGLGLSFALELAVRMLPTAVLGPIAGPLADRLPRKLLLVGGDLLRSVVVLGFLLVDGPEDLPLLYVLLFTQMGLGIFFDAARQATVPNTVPPHEIHEAIALSSVTWSTMLSVGALLGGAAIGPLGLAGVFVVDAGTYLASALLIASAKLPPTPPQDEPLRWHDLLTQRDLRRGFAHARERGIARALMTKAFWGPAGGFLICLSLLATERFGAPNAEQATSAARTGVALGWLLFARGIGTAFGPILARRFHGKELGHLLTQIRWGFVIAATCYALVPFAPSLPWAVVLVALAHLGGGALWVASTSFLQRTVGDRFRGRAHALDFFGMTVSFASFGLITGAVRDWTGSTDAALWASAGLTLGSGLVWWRFVRPMVARAGVLEAPAGPSN
jgi:MFS family permease